MDIANYLQNRPPTKRTDKTVIIPEKAWTKVRQDFSHIRIFGSKVSTHILSEKCFKSDVYKTWNGIFIRYMDTMQHLRVRAPKTDQVLIASEPVVNKSKRECELLVNNSMPAPKRPLRQSAGEPKHQGRSKKRAQIEAEHNGSVVLEESLAAEGHLQTGVGNSHDLLVQRPRTDRGGTSGKSPSGLVRPARELAKSVTETSSKVREPKTYNEAVNNPINGNRWREAIDEELWNLDTHQTWCYTPLPDNRKAIGCKWVFKVKYNSDGSVERYKARLVAQGFYQLHGIDYTETFASTIRHKSLRIFLAIATMLGMILIQMDVIGAYLESALDQNEQPIYMKIPQGCQAGREGLVCKILKSLYGLKQVGRLWNKIIIKFIQRIAFTFTNANACILTIKWKREFIIINVYIDDLVLGSRRLEALEWLKDQLMKKFSMKDLEEVKTIIGWEITQDLAAGTLRIDQKEYIQDFLESEGMTSYHLS